MTTMTISHADWELLEDAPRHSATVHPVSSTQFEILAPVGERTAVFTVYGSFTNPAGMTTEHWLANATGTVTSMTVAIGGVLQFNATGLSLQLPDILEDALDDVHDVIETVIGDQVSIRGSDDDDHLSGHGGDDSLSGGHGNDDLHGDLGDDSLSGGSGNDHLFGETGDDSLSGGDGDDSLSGSTGNDTLSGGSGVDAMSGGSGNDRYYVDNDLDRISESSVSTGGYDVEYASVSESGLASNVEKLVLTGTVAIKGVGNAGDNTLLGNSIANQMLGRDGNDLINGGLGNDTCDGGLGDDRLTGGRGTDRLKGGAGHDIFDFDAFSELGRGSAGRDQILDFSRGEDRIDLSTLDANSSLASDQAFRFVSAFSGNATGQVRYDHGIVQISTDADAQAEYEIALVGTPPASLSAADFIL